MRPRSSLLARIRRFWARSTDAIADGEARFWNAELQTRPTR